MSSVTLNPELHSDSSTPNSPTLDVDGSVAPQMKEPRVEDSEVEEAPVEEEEPKEVQEEEKNEEEEQEVKEDSPAYPMPLPSSSPAASTTEEDHQTHSGSEYDVDSFLPDTDNLEADEQEFVEVLEIDGNYAGVLIGRNGLNITHLEKESGAALQLVKAPPGQTKRQVEIRASNREKVTAAVIAVTRQYNTWKQDSLNQNMNAVRSTRPPSHLPQDMIYVPSSVVGSIIGKQGDTIQRLQRITKCFIQVDQSEGPLAQQRPVVVAGREENRVIACEVIQRIIQSRGLCSNRLEETVENVKNGIPFEMPTQTPGGGHRLMPGSTTVVVTVPDECCGFLIGRAGCQIKRMQDDSGCVIQIAPLDMSSNHSRRVSLTGTSQTIEMARSFIQARVEKYYAPSQFDDNGNEGGNGGSQHEGGGGYRGGNQQQQPDPSAAAINNMSFIRFNQEHRMRFGDVALGRVLYSGPQATRVVLQVPDAACGVVIGKAGSTIKQIQEDSKAHIDVASKEECATISRTGDRFVAVTGELQCVDSAIDTIHKKLGERNIVCVELERQVDLFGTGSGEPQMQQVAGSGYPTFFQSPMGLYGQFVPTTAQQSQYMAQLSWQQQQQQQVQGHQTSQGQQLGSGGEGTSSGMAGPQPYPAAYAPQMGQVMYPYGNSGGYFMMGGPSNGGGASSPSPLSPSTNTGLGSPQPQPQTEVQ